MIRVVLAVWCLFVSCLSSKADDAPPKSLDDRIRVELYAESPQIVTPTGIDVDAQGRVWAIESNTHFPPEKYTGHKTDRLLVFERTADGGRARQVTTFTDGFVHAMSVAVRPTGDIFVATRKEIVVLRDDNNDLKPDAPPKRIMLLDTPGDYPHDGLAGFAFDALGNMYFGCGENLGASYKLIGSDGTTLAGGGEGGNVYRCRPDGSRLAHWATGFWNPHASCVDAFGQLFSVDNDPDSRPPCRLLEIVPGGDYGYRYRNGRRGTHPFTAWDGELPGTLPMVAGTGEAPSGIVAYESDGLPEDYRGNLLATSWGDHRIDRFRLKRKGSSFTSRAEPIVSGGENFRPVGIAVAPDGSLFFTDWVLKDYTLHSKGRIWHIVPVKKTNEAPLVLADVSRRPADQLVKLLSSPRLDVRRTAAQALESTRDGLARLDQAVADRNADRRAHYEANWAIERAIASGAIKADDSAIQNYARQLPPRPADWKPDRDFDDARATLLSYRDLQHSLLNATLEDVKKQADFEAIQFDFNDPFDFRAAMTVIARFWDEQAFLNRLDAANVAHVPTRLFALLAARQKDPKQTAVVERALHDPDAAVRRAAVQWVGEEKLSQFRPQLEATLGEGAVTSELFEAVLASLQLLDGVVYKPTEEVPGSQYVLALLRDDAKPVAVRARALRMLSPTMKELDAPLLAKLVMSNDPTLKFEAVRTLQLSPLAEAAPLLQQIASDESLDVGLRAAAIAGLASWASSASEPNSAIDLLMHLATSPQRALQFESLRSLRSVADKSPKVRAFLESQRDALLGMSEPRDPATREWADQLLMALGTASQAAHPKLKLAGTERPADLAHWIEGTATGGDREAGERVFYHLKSAGCSRCHTVNGRGGRVGPDLTTIARTMDRRKLAQSILEPSREVAPQFVTWTVVTKEGTTYNGMIVSESRDGQVVLGDAEGKLVELSGNDIEQRVPQKISLMPEKLIDQLTVGEFRDLLAFLETLK